MSSLSQDPLLWKSVGEPGYSQLGNLTSQTATWSPWCRGRGRRPLFEKIWLYWMWFSKLASIFFFSFEHSMQHSSVPLHFIHNSTMGTFWCLVWRFSCCTFYIVLDLSANTIDASPKLSSALLKQSYLLNSVQSIYLILEWVSTPQTFYCFFSLIGFLASVQLVF